MYKCITNYKPKKAQKHIEIIISINTSIQSKNKNNCKYVLTQV